VQWLAWTEVGRGVTEGGFVVKMGLKASQTTQTHSS